MRTAILTVALSFSVVACSPATLKIGDADPTDGWVDTDGDGIPDSPDSDGDGIPDSEDDEPDIPNDEEDEEEEEEEDAPFPFAGDYRGGVSLEIWDTGQEYCDESAAEFEISRMGQIWGEGWCHNDWYDDEVELEYSGHVTDDGEISGTISITLWLPTGGHGNWELDTVDFEMEGSVDGNELDVEFEGEIRVGPNWGFDVNGESWGEK